MRRMWTARHEIVRMGKGIGLNDLNLDYVPGANGVSGKAGISKSLCNEPNSWYIYCFRHPAELAVPSVSGKAGGVGQVSP